MTYNVSEDRDAWRGRALEAEQAYNDLVGLLRQRFPQRPDGTLPDFRIEDVLLENTILREMLWGFVWQYGEIRYDNGEPEAVGHMFMSDLEGAFDYFEKIGWLSPIGGGGYWMRNVKPSVEKKYEVMDADTGESMAVDVDDGKQEDKD